MAIGNASHLAGFNARQKACDILYDVLCQNLTLSDAQKRHPISDEAFAKALSHLALRRLGEIDEQIFQLIDNPKPIQNHYALMILRILAAQCLFMRVPAFAATHLAVEIAKNHKKARHFAALINAVGRKLAKLTPPTQIRYERNIPQWLWQKWVAHYGLKTTQKIAKAHLDIPPLDISCAPQDREKINQHLDAIALAPHNLRLERKMSAVKIENLWGYQEGLWWVQDIAASLAVPLFGDIKNRNLLEFCASPGGKTAQMARGGALVKAIEINDDRALIWRDNMKRLQLDSRTQILIEDGRDYHQKEKADAILLDAPCLGTGTCRRHPDLVWRREKTQINPLCQQQKALLENAITMLAPQGVLIYCVCSLEAEEGIDIINHFLQDYPYIKRSPIKAEEVGFMSHILTKAGDVRSLPFMSPHPFFSQRDSGDHNLMMKQNISENNEGGMDGFYIARLVRT